MPKWCQIAKCKQWRLQHFLLTVLGLAVIINFFVFYGRFNYPHLLMDEIETALYQAVNPTIVQRDKPYCEYKNVLQSTNTLDSRAVPFNNDKFEAEGIVNGSYTPKQCSPLFSVAVLVTYRNRQKQLSVFIPYIHNFLRKQNINYKIYLIEQEDDNPWNKGLLYNIGAKQAIADGFPCLILHDVDLLPLDESNLYACTAQPRHLSASIDKFRFVLPYDWLVGGVLAVRSDQYVDVNGFSNRFINWGGEDDDFYLRLKENDIKIIRFPREMSRYTMLRHAPTTANAERWVVLAANRRGRGPAAPAQLADGLHAARAQQVRVRCYRLFMLLSVITY